MIEFEEHRFGFKDYRRSEKSQNSRDAQRALLCREEQLLLRFFGEGSSQLKRNRASLAKRGAESCGRLFSIWRSSAGSSNRFLASIAVPAHLSRVPPQRLLTSGTSIVLDTSRLPSPEYQIAEEDADGSADCDSDETKDEGW